MGNVCVRRLLLKFCLSRPAISHPERRHYNTTSWRGAYVGRRNFGLYSPKRACSGWHEQFWGRMGVAVSAREVGRARQGDKFVKRRRDMQAIALRIIDADGLDPLQDVVVFHVFGHGL
jgi:hypothetical protein